ncbi:MAG: ArnT family glycosyltransferase [Phycisphaerales bacterium]
MRDSALHSGGLVIPKLQGRDRLNKPPLSYWLQAASAAVFTAGRPLLDSIWMYRVPSLLAAIAAVLLTWRLGTSMFDSRTGRLAAALLACCPLVAWEARQARADMVLLALNTAAMLALWRVYSLRTPRLSESSNEASGTSLPSAPESASARSSDLGWAITFWLTLSLAILTKGPITPLITALTVLFLCLISRRWRWLLALRPYLGLVIVAAVVAPWVYLVGARVGWLAYMLTVADETLGRVASSREGHWGPPGCHTLVLAVLFWPGSLMTAAGIALAFRQGLVRATGETGGWLARLRSLNAGHAPYLFCLCWIIPAWIVFELIWTKLPHYTLPMYPAIALLSARAVLAMDARMIAVPRTFRIGFVAWIAIGAVLVLLWPLVRFATEQAGDYELTEHGQRVYLAVLPTIAAAAYLFLAGRLLLRGHHARAQLAGLLVSILSVAWSTIGLAFPGFSWLWTSDRVGQRVRTIDPAGVRPVAAVGYHEDSLLFALRGRVERIEERDLTAWFVHHPTGLAVVSRAVSQVTPGLRSLKSDPRSLGFLGFNYTKGDPVALVIVEADR